MDREDKPVRLPRFNSVKYPLFVVGLGLFGGWLHLVAGEIMANVETIFSEPALLLGAVLLIAGVGFSVIKWQIGKSNGVAIV